MKYQALENTKKYTLTLTKREAYCISMALSDLEADVRNDEYADDEDNAMMKDALRLRQHINDIVQIKAKS